MTADEVMKDAAMKLGMSEEEAQGFVDLAGQEQEIMNEATRLMRDIYTAAVSNMSPLAMVYLTYRWIAVLRKCADDVVSHFEIPDWMVEETRKHAEQATRRQANGKTRETAT